MPTKPQIITIQTAKRKLGLTDPAYRTLLKSVGKVESSKDLSNDGVENVMAVLEAMGFQSHPAGPTYWRDKADKRGDRQLYMIHSLSPRQRYDLGAMCERFSAGRTSAPEQLTPQEKYRLIEMLKDAVERERNSRPATRIATPQPVTEGTDAEDLPF